MVLREAASLLQAANDSRARESFRTLRAILRTGKLEPDNRLFSTAIAKCMRAKDRRDAMALLREMPQPTIADYNAVLAGFGKADDLQRREIEEMVEQMAARNLRPDRTTYYALLSACVAIWDGKSAEGLLREAAGKMALEEGMWTLVITAYVKENDPENAERIYRELMTQDLRLNYLRQTEGKLIKAYEALRNGPGALRILKGMSDPNIIDCNMTLSAHLKRADREIKWEGIRQVMLIMQANNLQSNRSTYTTIMNAHAEDGNGRDAEAMLRNLGPVMLRDFRLWDICMLAYALAGDGRRAERLFREMQAHGIKPNPIGYRRVIKAYSKTGAWMECDRLFREMLGQIPELIPDTQTIDLMTSIYARINGGEGAVQLLEGTLSSSARTVWNVALGAVLEARNFPRAAALWRRMREQDPPITPTVEGCIQLISMFVEAGDMESASRCIDDTVEAGVFTRTAGYDRRWDELDFHFDAVVHPAYHASRSGITVALAVALLGYHLRKGSLRDTTHLIVGGGSGSGRIKEAVLQVLDLWQRPYVEAQRNPGRLVPLPS